VIAIGIVGEIGSGKTYVSKVFENYGYGVFYADKVVHDIYKKNKFINKKLSKIFKLSSKRVDLKYLTNLIIKDPYRLSKLNKIIHPEVKKKLLHFIRKNKKKKLIVLDIPLLLETDFKYFADILVFIEISNRRLIKFRNKRKIDIKLINVLKKFQIDKETKKNLSDFIISNTSSKLLKNQVKTIINKILLNDQ